MYMLRFAESVQRRSLSSPRHAISGLCDAFLSSFARRAPSLPRRIVIRAYCLRLLTRKIARIRFGATTR